MICPTAIEAARRILYASENNFGVDRIDAIAVAIELLAEARRQERDAADREQMLNAIGDAR